MTKGLTKLDRERLLKTQTGEINEYLEEAGQEDEEKAAKVVIEVEKKREKESAEDELKKFEEVEKERKKQKKDYVQKLAQMADEMARFLRFPSGYIYRVNYNEEKLNIKIKSPDGKIYAKGIKPCGIAFYDFKAVETLVTQCENTIDSLEKEKNTTKSGIIIPQ